MTAFVTRICWTVSIPENSQGGKMENLLTYRSATAADWPAIEALLLAARLPLDGARDHLEQFLVGEDGGEICCAAGYERYGELALLRSVAVAQRWRGQGMGKQMLESIKARARIHGIRRLYLLTTTAPEFFAGHGFVRAARNTAPAALQASREFQGVCPASATFMVASLDSDRDIGMPAAAL
ncbi:arsenic resistance N-acetyltransferase ArsN2 [Pseudoduganella umbonata]|nr:arsenic resistance N-acetyltransferase ArsN2 [Pseudoduganella umbonata]MBB3219808.1 amino-acid N-acetyltransferase [Pseudoduganella umbonata]